MKNNLSSQIKLDQVPKKYYAPENKLEFAALCREEKVYTSIFETADEGAAHIAEEVAKTIRKSVDLKGKCVVALGAGNAVIPVYTELISLYKAGKVTFDNLVIFNIADFYPSADGQPKTIDRLQKIFISQTNVKPENVHTFNVDTPHTDIYEACKAYEADIDAVGGLDLAICEIGASGNIAFNEPGSQQSSGCRLSFISSQTRRAMSSYYNVEVAPTTAITLGISNILSAKRIICMSWGETMSKVVAATVEGQMGEAVPASFLQSHRNAEVVLDLSAAEKLTRINHPWLVTSCEWNNKLIRRAIAWLCHETGKPILKLTNKDFNDHGLNELVALYGSAYDVNIKVFNDIQHTITGWPGGKPNADDASRPERATPYPKRVVCFSPHPDDVVVSMGGTLRRLVQQGHDVHVVFQTNGDMMVNDEDLERTIMLTNRLANHFDYGSTKRDEVVNNITETLRSKKPGDADTPEIRYAKGAILECECVTSCRFLGVSPDKFHELNLPFYSRSPLGNGKVTEADVTPIKDLLQELKPHQIFFADDYDPNGVNERASEALILAVMQLKNEPWMKDCRLWMYRGQWGQWEIDNIEMTVPMSPEEFGVKRQAILKHQSQVHDAPFRDPENGQLAWQTSIDRNTALADLYSRLGLASYEAMEAFVRYHIED